MKVNRKIIFGDLAKSNEFFFFVIPAPHQVRDKLQRESRKFIYF
jgi:hypothetical protein